MVKAMGSEWEPNVFIPASKMIQTLDTPGMQPFLKEFNVSAYGVKVILLLIFIKPLFNVISKSLFVASSVCKHFSILLYGHIRE